MKGKRMGSVLATALMTIALLHCGSVHTGIPGEYSTVDRLPRMSPDYAAVTIPCNIAPLNFVIQEPGDRFIVDAYEEQGVRHIVVRSKRPAIRFPQKKWHKLINRAKGRAVRIDVFVRDGATWKRFSPIVNNVSPDAIDRYLVYRSIPPVYTTWGAMGIYQRDVSSFHETPVIINRMTGNNCMNCHTFNMNNPDYMVMHMRVGPCNGTFVKRKNELFKVNTATELTRPGGNPAWHPSGAYITFSVDKIRQFFHATGGNREGINRAADIVLYDIAANVILSTPELASAEYMETQPEWSPDGRFLYYCRSPQFFFDTVANAQARIVFDLMRIPFNPDNGTWGESKPVLTHEQTGGSIRQQRVSPDGNFIVFSMAPFGSFNTYRPGSDIYILDLRTMSWRKCDVNSDKAESFPCWSSNGRWFVFSSKRDNGICSRPYFSHVDKNGNTSKPIILPQDDPMLYDSYLMNYNLPTLAKKPVRVSPRRIADVMYDNKHIRNAILDTKTKEWKERQPSSPTHDKKPKEMWQWQESSKKKF